MRTLFHFATCFCLLLLTASVSAQNSGLEFKVQLLDENGTYGVFVKPDQSIAPSGKTQTGSGQVTLVTPVGFEYSNLKNFGGTWIENARVEAPVEAMDKAYVSFGFVVDQPRIQIFPSEETLLFTFTCGEDFIGEVELFNNESDPFQAPNSYSSNPGNDLGMIDVGAKGGLAYYSYARNYSTEAQQLRENSTLASK